MNKRRFLTLITAGLLLVTACNFPTTAEPKSDPADAVQTSAAQTVNAQFTRNAQLTPSETATLAPSDTPEPSNTPEPQEPTDTPSEIPTETLEIACDSILFVADVTIPDGSEIDLGESFTKTWRLENAGTCTWTTDYDLVFASGDAMDGPAAQALAGDVAPGAQVDISVVLTVPATEGDYRGNWQLRNKAGVVFGLPGPFYVEVKAIETIVGSTTVNLSATDNGSVRSNTIVNPNPNAGDTDSDVESQAFVSFDISAIPDAATINFVRVDFTDYNIDGDPFTELGCLRAYQGSFFPLDAADHFSGSPSGAVLRWCDAAELSTTFRDEDVKDSLQSVLGDSTFELRLQFNETDTNSDGTADMARFGEVKLRINYTAP